VLLDRVSKVAEERDSYLHRESEEGAATGFDGEVQKTLRKAGAKAGLTF
jgi:hypothetical protein